jgi:hypothetical protein
MDDAAAESNQADPLVLPARPTSKKLATKA